MIRSVGVIGAGLMGRGIAQVCASAGFETVLTDVSQEALDRGYKYVCGSIERLAKRGLTNADEAERVLSRLTVTTERAALAKCDLVIEAATENESVKVDIIREVSALLAPKAVFATNTSSISITRLAAVSARPERVIGMHFFNPVPAMALLELIRGVQTSDDTHKFAEGFAAAIGKRSINAKNRPGFAVNRILCPMINEAIFVLQEGIASAEEIDDGMKLGANHAIGPLALADLVGLDTMLSVMTVLYRDFNDPKYRPAPLLREMVDAGRLGKKSGEGFYRYST